MFFTLCVHIYIYMWLLCLHCVRVCVFIKTQPPRRHHPFQIPATFVTNYEGAPKVTRAFKTIRGVIQSDFSELVILFCSLSLLSLSSLSLSHTHTHPTPTHTHTQHHHRHTPPWPTYSLLVCVCVCEDCHKVSDLRTLDSVGEDCSCSQVHFTSFKM